jgi:hypothetical protein
MANKYMKKGFISVVIRKMHKKTTFHLTPCRMVVIKRGRWVGRKTLYTVGRNVN